MFQEHYNPYKGFNTHPITKTGKIVKITGANLKHPYFSRTWSNQIPQTDHKILAISLYNNVFKYIHRFTFITNMNLKCELCKVVKDISKLNIFCLISGIKHIRSYLERTNPISKYP